MMLARALWSRLFPNPGYFGWRIVGIGMLCSMLSAPGQSFAISLYLDHLIRDLGLTRVGVSSLYAAATLAAAVALPLVGAWADRTTARRYLGTVLVLFGCAIAMLAQVGSVVALAVAFFALRLLGQGAIGLGTLTATVHWFRRYRGRALAVVSLGYALGELLFPGAILLLIETLGWRGSLLALAALYLVVFAPLVVFFTRDRTEADGPADGAVLPLPDTDGTTVRREDPSFPLAAILRMPVFWGMLLCMSVPPMLLTAVIFHQVALFEARGWSPLLIPAAFAAYALASVGMTYAAGLAMERVPSRYGASLSLGLAAVGVGWLVWGTAMPQGALLYGALLGLAAGAGGAANSIVWPDYFGVEALGAVKGVVTAVRNGATALGPPAVAVLAGTTGGFTAPLLLLAAMAAGTALFALFLTPPGAAVQARTGDDTPPEPRALTATAA